jgi:Fe2+ or Zn2+ uptake regulation protein
MNANITKPDKQNANPLYQDIKEAGIRPTKARIAILELFNNKKINHLSCEQIVKELKTSTPLGQATIYQNVKILADNGLLSPFKGPEGMLYQRANQMHHHHLICRKCGTIEDVLVKGHCDALIPKAIDQQSQIDNWAIENRTVEFFGYCPQCAL